jgi:hypothetical protein
MWAISVEVTVSAIRVKSVSPIVRAVPRKTLPHKMINAQDSTHIAITFLNGDIFLSSPKTAFMARSWTSRRHVIIIDRAKFTPMVSITNTTSKAKVTTP